MPSKNDVFSETFTVSPPPSPGRSRAASSSVSIPTISLKPALAPLDTSLSVVKPSKSLQLQLSPVQLGCGRHAVVHLAAYRLGEGESWRVCAAKRLSGDKEAQLAGLNEACMLSRLSKCNEVLRFLGLKDEGLTATKIGSAIDPGDATGPASTAGGARSVPASPVQDEYSCSTPTPFASASSLRRAVSVKHARTPSRLSQNVTASASDDDESPSPSVPRLVLVVEYCALGSLADFVNEYGRQNLGPRLFYKLASDILKAIRSVHQRNIIHADIKPQNFMLTGHFDLKLGDFSSSLFNAPNLDDGIALGTTQYAPPELIKPPPSPFSFPVDIFSAGLTILFMLTGVEPYQSILQNAKEGNISRGSRRKVRTSSGAGRTMELHLHLSKGHAWMYEEARRLEELEEEDSLDPLSLPCVRPFGGMRMPHTFLGLPSDLEDCAPSSFNIPEHLQDAPARDVDRCRDTYDDGTPVQLFLSGRHVVPTALRNLLQDMLQPAAQDRPSAAEALDQLEALEAIL